MLVLSHCEELPLMQEDVQSLWDAVREKTGYQEQDQVSIQCVSEDKIRLLNKQYRSKDAPTNVLTFSYGDNEGHDIALCMSIAVSEAADRKVDIRDYAALLLVHALLHAAGLDHDHSAQEDARTKEYERAVLTRCGFVSQALSDVY